MIYDTVIIGGGITGLSTAFYLEKSASQSDKQHSYAILEASDKWGGKIGTKTVQIDSGEQFLIETGADSFLVQKPWAMELVKELNLEKHLINTDRSFSQTWIFHKGRLVALPEGLMLMVPTKFLPFLLSPLVSLAGKIRMAFEVLIPRRKVKEDESLARFISRRMGKEILDSIAEPLLGSVFGADPARQSVFATFPHFVEMERKHGSLLIGFIKARLSKKPKAQSPYTMIVSLDGGMQQLSNAVLNSLSGHCYLNSAITSISQLSGGEYLIRTENGVELKARSIVSTITAKGSARLLSAVAPEASNLLGKIPYVSSANMNMAFKAEDVPDFPNGFGVLVPKSEDKFINAISFSSQKFPGRAPQDYRLIRVSCGGARNRQVHNINENEISSRIKTELKEILKIDAEPVFAQLQRWDGAMPQYNIGHLSKIEQIEKLLPKNIYVAGSGFRGVSIPDCVYQGKKVAQSILSNS